VDWDYEGVGPTDENIAAGVRGFAREFHYWYYRVLHEALPKYQRLIIDRINPLIRSMEFEGLSAKQVAHALVGDYARRNFVTAGGWALEQLAIAGSPSLAKSAAAGIDAEKHLPGAVPVSTLYVIKSGTVTRNSDILKQLKSHGQEAHKRLLQSNKRAVIKVVYAVLTGRATSSFEDGVYRPSSAEFWAEAFELENEARAVELALAMGQEASSLLSATEGNEVLRALELAVEVHIRSSGSNAVDWDYLARRNMRADASLREEEKVRRALARAAVEASGYEFLPAKPSRRAAVAAESAALDDDELIVE
jgi:hypothetical protein